MNLVELIEASDRLLSGLGLSHAFGGALALGYHAAPRATTDVDVNVFVPFDRAVEVVEAFEAIELRPELAPERWMPAAGIRLLQDAGGAVVDLFVSLDASYDRILERCVERPFGSAGNLIPILSAEDLIVFKLSFGRPKDWVDLDALARSAPDLDLDGIEEALVALRGPTIHPRLTRFRAMVDDSRR